jgi:hypothetical protein
MSVELSYGAELRLGFGRRIPSACPRIPALRSMVADAMKHARHLVQLVEPRTTDWLRFNVAFSEDERIFRFLSDQIQS